MNGTSILNDFDFPVKPLPSPGAGCFAVRLARGLFDCGANLAILDYNLEAAQKLVSELAARPANGKSIAVQVNVLQPESVRAAIETTGNAFGRVDGLINGAGGSKPDATSTEKSFFDLPPEAIRMVFDLNLLSAISFTVCWTFDGKPGRGYPQYLIHEFLPPPHPHPCIFRRQAGP